MITEPHLALSNVANASPSTALDPPLCVEEDRILARNPCRFRGAGFERAPERPVLIVDPGLRAGRIGRAPPDRQHPAPPRWLYRLRYRRHEIMRAAPEVYPRRPTAEAALRAMGKAGRAVAVTGSGASPRTTLSGGSCGQPGYPAGLRASQTVRLVRTVRSSRADRTGARASSSAMSPALSLSARPCRARQSVTIA